MVNSFTRAAGAAERVLSLYDLQPDIDPDAGAPVEEKVTRWDIAFEEVRGSGGLLEARRPGHSAAAAARL